MKVYNKFNIMLHPRVVTSDVINYLAIPVTMNLFELKAQENIHRILSYF